ncbi:hypothetical protein D9611_009052 [Ephemerocybe angulata]|uniref:CxC5 like cysteine cluster associated with KDZ domain-containing protein n=1 Tax=Ephemerocybe angulata TaxID=980116 RepID=A0A8H5CDF5_9AGAR|nr:hypothetical protein D9611_009052 [Tulosesus angulatus]
MPPISDLPLAHLLKHLSSLSTHVSENVSFRQFCQFRKFACRLKREIELATTSNLLPLRLPVYVHDFLRDAVGIDDSSAIELWDITRDDVASSDEEPDLTKDEVEVFLLHGSQDTNRKTECIGPAMFYPPSKFCLTCKAPLKGHSRYPITYFSLRFGAIGGYSSSLHCKACKIRFYPTYSVQFTKRTYYSSAVPDIIHSEEHTFVDRTVCELFTAQMVHAWVSGSNCANIYNICLTQGIPHPVNWPRSSRLLTAEQVWNAFFLNALLRDASERDIALIMNAIGLHEDRMKLAMISRNERISQYGQPQRMHACSKCEIPHYKTGQPLRGVVTDGITLGRPCCTVHNCTRPLVTNRARFCAKHMSKLQHICVADDCTEAAVKGRKTCGDPKHQAGEDAFNRNSKAFFQLKKRLANGDMPQLLDSLNGNTELIAQVIAESVESDLSHGAKSDSGNKKVKLRLARRRTHNEQLVVCCCGVIAARATMFGAEAISGVKDLLKSVYQFDKRQLPDVIFYDTNCQMQSHLQASGDTFFSNTLLPIDVFHYTSKHKVTDDFCQKHCNPAQFKELVDDAGNWKLNSSAAEQANVWMGGFLAMTREMLPHHFDFFLDEAIKRRNEWIVEGLFNAGHAPYIIPV